MVNIIATTIQTIGVILSIIVIGLLGIKYMTGSVEEKADYKKSMIPFLIGTVLIVAVGTIISAYDIVAINDDTVIIINIIILKIFTFLFIFFPFFWIFLFNYIE